MSASRTQIFCMFLQYGEPMSRPMLRARWKKYFGAVEGYQFLYPALTDLIKLGVLDEFDLEISGSLDGASISHPEHGDIDIDSTGRISGLDELVHLASGAPAFAMENVSELTDIAAKVGMDAALKVLTRMPIDSTAWTGFPKGFVLNERSKGQISELLEKAAVALERSNLSNFEIGQGSAYLRSAKILIDAPEPPQQEIWSIINKGSAIASLTSFFMPILSLFAGK